MQNPDSRIADDWTTLPKNFTMFAVKFINPFHGKYLHKGAAETTDFFGNEIETIKYSEDFEVKNEVWNLKTTSKNEVAVEGGNIRSTYIPGKIQMVLKFSDDGQCIVSEAPNSNFSVAGRGRFMKKTEEWGNQKRNAIYINYTMSNATHTYSAVDTLIIRDRNVVMELFNPQVID